MMRVKILLFLLLCLGCVSGLYASHPDSVQTQCQTENDTMPNIVNLVQNYPELVSFLDKHNLPLEQSDNIPLYDMIRRWYRTPYRWAGTSKKGVDCQGFVLVLNDSLYNRTLPRGAGSQYMVTQPVKKEDLKEGDLVFFKIGTYAISHVGLYLKNGKFVHASSGYGVIISDLNEPYYKRWFFSGGRVVDEKVKPTLRAGL
jgi:lipoprotein Spr